MAYQIEYIEGVGPAMAKKLAKAGITNTNHLLKHCCSKKGRKAMAGSTGCTEQQLLKWANMADLMRISGIGSEYSELLEAAGVDTVKELRNRNAANLAEAMKTTNAKKKLTRLVPGEKTVTKWVAAAKKLDPVITH